MSERDGGPRKPLPLPEENGRGLHFGGVKIPGRLVTLLLVLALTLSVARSFVCYVGPNEFGIKQIKIGAHRGIQKEIYSPGWVFVVPAFSEVLTLPRSIQVFDLTGHPEERATANNPSDRAAHIQTSDGFFVDVDVTILYRIVDPYGVITTLGPGEMYITNGIVPRAEAVLKQTLGTLTTEEFYNSPLRSQKVQSAEALMQEQLSSKGMKVEKILIRYFRYSPEIQKNIEEKKLKDQLVFKNQAEKFAATEEALLKKAIQEGEATVLVKLQEGQAYITEKQAAQELVVRKKHAEADLEVRLAEAYRTELRNKALQGTGSNRMVGLKMAEVMQGVRFIMLPSDGPNGLNPLDLNQVLKLIGSEEKK